MSRPETQKQTSRDNNSNRPANPAYVAFEAKRNAIEKRIENIRAQMVMACIGCHEYLINPLF
jgi:hypothetical protein